MAAFLAKILPVLLIFLVGQGAAQYYEILPSHTLEFPLAKSMDFAIRFRLLLVLQAILRTGTQQNQLCFLKTLAFLILLLRTAEDSSSTTRQVPGHLTQLETNGQSLGGRPGGANGQLAAYLARQRRNGILLLT